jgi:hypothetical protein
MPRWSTESKAIQAAAIREWSPWTQSTGPTSSVGKATSSRNAHRQTMRKFSLLADFLAREQSKFLTGKPYATVAEIKARLADNFTFFDDGRGAN